MNKLQKPRGTQDIFLQQSEVFNFIVETAQSVAESHNFSSIRTPTFENAELFERNIGQETDAVSKELYRFQDQSSRNLALRPEFTAGIVRAFCENKELYTYNIPLRLFSWGQVFRYDRPKKGRYREFHQINFELFGDESDISADISAIGIAIEVLKALGVLGKTTLLINFLGDAKTPYTEAVRQYFFQHSDALSEISKTRLEKNPLRILDSKEPQDIVLFENLPQIEAFYSQKDTQTFNQITDFLTHSNVNFKIDKHLVRGLDYYTGIVFEFIAPIAENGENLAVLGGGRYDLLISQMGGKPCKAVGFGGGIERLAMLCMCGVVKKRVFVINTTGKSLFSVILKLQKKVEEVQNEKKLQNKQNLQFQEIPTEKNKIGKTLQKLGLQQNAYAIIVGENEMQTGKMQVKNLETSEIETTIEIEV